MSVVRVNHNTNYTVMSNHHLRNMNLSLKAVGLLSKILSLPPDWDYTIEGLAAICKDGVTAVKGALKELKDEGYLVVTKLMPDKTKSGRIEYIYDIYEQPQEKQALEKQEVENLQVEIQGVENPLQLNTNKSSKEVLSKEELKTNYKEEFENLWSIYPNKKGKTNALKDYITARKSGVKFEDVLSGLYKYIEYINLEKTPEKYIKHGSTWFHQHCWEDDYTTKRRLTTNDISQAYDFSNYMEGVINDATRVYEEHSIHV